MGATTDRDLYLDLYWIADAVFINDRRENENESKNFQVWLKYLKKAQKLILGAVWRLFCISFVDTPVVIAKTNNGQVIVMKW